MSEVTPRTIFEGMEMIWNDMRVRRDIFAAAALTGLLAHGQGDEYEMDAIARHAKRYADALIAELDRERP